MKLSSVRLSVCPSVRPTIRPPHAAAVGLLLWARRPADIGRLLHGRRSAANASSVTLSADADSRTQTCSTERRDDKQTRTATLRLLRR